MAQRLVVQNEEAKTCQPTTYNPIGKIHKREVVSGHGRDEEQLTVRQVFEKLLDGEGKLRRDPKNPLSIDSIADLFVNDVKEKRGWYDDVMGIVSALEISGKEEMRKLAASIRFHAEQAWAERHCYDRNY